MSEKAEKATDAGQPVQSREPHKDFGQTITLGEILSETAKICKEGIAPGLTLSNVLGDVAHEMKAQWDQGRQELATALYGEMGGFIQYPRQEKQEGNEQEQERGGREM
jgi:hypothetical protein